MQKQLSFKFLTLKRWIGQLNKYVSLNFRSKFLLLSDSSLFLKSFVFTIDDFYSQLVEIKHFVKILFFFSNFLYIFFITLSTFFNVYFIYIIVYIYQNKVIQNSTKNYKQIKITLIFKEKYLIFKIKLHSCKKYFIYTISKH